MRIRIPNKLTSNVFNILRKAGYLQIIDRQTEKESFVRKISGNRYPRFHVYLEENPEQITLNIHLDQTKTRYQGQTAHKADYDSKEVEIELQRIFEFFKSYLQKNPIEENSINDKKSSQNKNWIQKLLDL